MTPLVPMVYGPAEIGIFLLANVIIILICGPPLLREIRNGMFRKS